MKRGCGSKVPSRIHVSKWIPSSVWFPSYALEVHGHRAIGRDTQAVDQLLEIGAALFAVPPLELNGHWILTVVGT